jgi:2,3,4,5-tetrahydropyridine-2-carboxylate N-succinyltransferase
MIVELKKAVEDAWEDRTLLNFKEYRDAIERTIDRLDIGELRVAEPVGNAWVVNDWIKKAVILYFPIREMEEIKVGPFVFHDKMKLKTDYKEKGVRVVPHGIARYGAFLAKGVI